MNDAERLKHIEDFGAMLDRAVAAEAERDALQEQLDRLHDAAMWVPKNFEEWRDSPIDGDAFATLMAAITELGNLAGDKS